MQLADDEFVFSATDLINRLECAHLTQLDLGVASGRLDVPADRPDATGLIARKGDEHERGYLRRLTEEGREVVSIKSFPGRDGIADAARQTVEAMRAGAEVIYQAALFDGARWLGYSDFLIRVDRPSELGAFSYEVADTKLAHRVKPYFLLQLCFYSELVEAIQGLAPRSMHVVLGTLETQTFRVADYSAYFRRVKHDFDAELDAGLVDSYPEPVEHCAVCRWEPGCAARRDADDHLSLVARIQRSQRTRLVERGIETMSALGRATRTDRPPRIGTPTFDALSAQARLQAFQRETGELRYELLPSAQGSPRMLGVLLARDDRPHSRETPISAGGLDRGGGVIVDPDRESSYAAMRGRR